MPRRRDPIYQRGDGRYWADLRYLGGRRIALKPPGETRATKDEVVAQVLLAEEIKELKQAQREHRDALLRGEEHGRRLEAGLGAFATHHLVKKAEKGRVTTAWVARNEAHLRVAVDFFRGERELRSISPRDVKRFIEHLAKRPNGRGGRLSGGTQRHHLNALSNLYRIAIEEGYAEANPVAALVDKPSSTPEEADWLMVPDAAALIEAARRYQPPAESNAAPWIHELIATFLLTGGRRSEVLGLEGSDVSFERGTVTFRPNQWRRLKTRTSHRTVPLWPQLAEILLAYGNRPHGAETGLWFPSRVGGLVQDFRKQLDSVAETAGWEVGEIRSKMFRHTYCSARLQTADRIIRTLPDGEETEQWVPVSPFSVAKELGHGGAGLVEKVYGHVAGHPHRAAVVEYRPENHREHVKKRLKLVA